MQTIVPEPQLLGHLQSHI